MKYLDLGIQTIIFVFGIVILFVSWGDADWPFGILYAQLVLGPWQMISSIVSVITKAPLYRKKALHLSLAAIYLFALFACGNMGSETLVQRFFGVMLTVPAWTLAIFYYILTCKWVLLRKRNGGNFLPNLSF
jgi:hypothetical protein